MLLNLGHYKEKGAATWLNAIPSSYNNAFKSKRFHLPYSMRLGIILPFSQLLEHCDCGQKLDQKRYHLIARNKEEVLFIFLLGFFRSNGTEKNLLSQWDFDVLLVLSEQISICQWMLFCVIGV